MFNYRCGLALSKGASQMRGCDGEPNNQTGSVETQRRLWLALTLRVLGALPFAHHGKDNAHSVQTQLHSNNTRLQPALLRFLRE